jgi:O-antigen/teichoic acid export membrane protein
VAARGPGGPRRSGRLLASASFPFLRLRRRAMSFRSIAAQRPGPTALSARLASGALWTLAARGAFALSGLLANMLLTRLLAPADFGAYVLAVSLIGALTLLSQLGLQVAVVRFVSEALNQGALARAQAATLMCVLLALCGAAGIGFAYAMGASHLVARLLGADALRQNAVTIALWICVATPLGVLAEAFRGFQRFRLAALFGGLSYNLVLLVLVALAFALQGQVSLQLILSFSVAASALSLAAAVRQFLEGNTAARVRGQMPSIEKLAAVSLPLMVMSLATFVTTQADLWIAGVFLPKSEVAAYGAAVRLVQLILVPLLVVNAVIAPTIAQLYSGRETKKLERVLGASAAISALPGVFVLGLFVLFAEPILVLLYGEPYGQAAKCLALVSLGQLVNTFCGPAATVMTMSGQQRAVMWVSLLTASIAAVGGAMLAGSLGLEGIAIAAGLATSVHGCLCLLWVRKSLGIWTFPRPSYLLRYAFRRPK